MKKSNVRKNLFGAFFGIVFSISMTMGMTADATGQSETAKTVSLIYEASKVSGINLNGNSVVIKESATNSDYVNIYIDENRNGVIDDNENMVALDTNGNGASTDINATVPIYGLYRQSGVSIPISIVVESGKLHSIHGVCNSQISTTEDNALKIVVKGGTLSDGLYGIETAGVITDSTKTAIDIDVSNNAIVKKYFKGVTGSYDFGAKVVGNIDIVWNVTNLPAVDDGMYSFYGVTNYATVEGDVDIYINNLCAQSIDGLYYDVKVNGNYTFKSEFETSVTHEFYGMYSSVVYGDADITVHGAHSDESTIPYVYGIYGNYTGETVAVDGDYKFTYIDGYASNLGAASVGAQTINGDVTVNIQSGKAENVWLLTNVTVQGSLNANVSEDCEIIEDLSGATGGSIKDNAIIKLYNAYTGDNTKTNYCKALSNAPVGGDVSILVDGGYYNDISVIQNTSKNMISIGGQVDITMRNVECSESTLINKTNVGKNVDLEIDKSKITYIFVMNSVTVHGKTDIDFKNSALGKDTNSNNTYMLFGCTNVGVARINVTNTSLSGSGSVYPCDGATSDSADVYFNMSNMTIKDSVKVRTQATEGQELHMILQLNAKVGEASTAENPLADVSALFKGMMYPSGNYSIIEVMGLPEGIMFENDKIYGTPTKAYVDGQDATITMTDGFDEENLTVHFIVDKKECVFDSNWTSDDKYHWHACTDKDCLEVQDKTEHKWDEGKVTIEPTETKTGTRKYTCICGAEKEETVPVLEHTKHVFKTSWIHNENEHWHTCENADCDEVSAKEKHQYGEAEIVVVATKNNEGTKKYTCSTCGYSYTEQYNIELAPTQEPLKEKEAFKDEENQIDYIVTSATNAEIEFVEFGNTTVTELEIPDTVTYGGITYKITSIAPDAFKNHKTLTKVVIGPNVLTIGKNAFYGCKKLSSVTIGANVITIGDSAFQNCIALKKITIPAKVTKIGNKAFYGCKKLSTVNMGKGIETIGNNVFQNCIALKKIEIPSKVEKIGTKAFYGCKKLTNMTIKTTKLNTSKVGKQAFTKAGSSNYKKLTVKVPKKKLKAYKTMLKKCGLSSKAKVKK